MAISAYLAAAEALERLAPREFALRTLDRILAEGWNAETGALAHVIAYGDGHRAAAAAPAVLEDYAYTVHACLDAWQVTASMRYYQAASAIADAMIVRFEDKTGGGFFDAERPANGAGLGALGVRRKPLQDAPTPAGNPSAAAALLRLHALDGREALRELAEDTLECFGGIVEQFGLYASSYGLALERLLLPAFTVVVVGSDDKARHLRATASARYAINKLVLHLTAEQVTAGSLPPVLAETLPHLPVLQASTSFAVVCRGTSCLPPVFDPEALAEALQHL